MDNLFHSVRTYRNNIIRNWFHFSKKVQKSVRSSRFIVKAQSSFIKGFGLISHSFERAFPTVHTKLKRHRRHARHLAFTSLFLIAGIFLYDKFVYAATYNFTQSSWSGGSDAVSVASHTSNQTNWTKFATSTGLTVGSTVQLTATSYTFTDDGATSTSPTASTFGGGFSSGTNSSTAITGSGVGASVVLSGGTTVKDTRADYTVGAGPWGVAFDSSTNSIWTANQVGNSVTKVNASTGAVIGTYSVGAGPRAIAFDSSTNSIWVANVGGGTVTKLNASNGSLVGTYSVGTSPMGVVFDSSTNSVWVSNNGSSNVTKLTASSGALVGTYAVGTGPIGITFDSSTNSIWVANLTANSVTKLTASTGAAVGTYAVGTSPYGIAFDPSTNSVWTSNQGSANATKLAASSGALVGTYAAGTNPYNISFDSSTNSIWIANSGSNNVTKLTASTGAAVGTYTVGAVPIGVAFDSSTNSIWVSSYNSGSGTTVTKLSAATGSGATSYTVGTTPWGVAYDSFTGSVWVANFGANTVTKLDSSTGAVVGTYAVGTSPYGVAFDSSTNSIWVANNGSANVKKLNASTGAVTGTYSVGTNPKGVTFDSSTNSIWVANNGSNNVTKLNASTGALIGTYTVGVSPVGITFESFTNSVWAVNSGASTVTKLNASTGAVTGTYTVGANPYGVVFDSSTNSIWTVAGGNVTKINASTGASIGTYATGGTNAYDITFDTSTNSIWTANGGSNNISKLNASTGALIGIYTVGSNPYGIAFDSATGSVWVSDNGSNNVTKLSLIATVYSTPGTFTSAAINLGASIASFGTLSWSATLNSQTVALKARSSATLDFSSAPAWASCTSITSGQALSTGGCVTNGHQYIQYQATLSTGNTAVSPTLNSVDISYTQYTNGNLTSSIYNTENAGNLVTAMRWIATGTSTTETVKFQVRSASTTALLSSAVWCGPGIVCDGTTYFTDSSSAAALASNHPLRSGGDDQYFQYKVFLSSGGSFTPSLTSATVQYVVNAPPEFDATYGTNGVTVSQVATTTDPNYGKVVISYKIRDADGTEGSVTPSQVTPSFEYNTGSGWVAIASSTLATGDASNKAVDNVNYTTYTATWSATSSVSNIFSASARVRVTINDNEAANNTAAAISSTFTLDTKSPVVTATFDSSTGGSGAGTITLTTTDDSQSQYRICNDSSFPSSDTQGNSCAWTTLSNNLASSSIAWIPTGSPSAETVYINVRDVNGNMTSQTLVAPALPASFAYVDISNLASGSYQEFLSWAVYQATTSAVFSSYKLYNSTDGVSYSLLATITDADLNYYRHSITTGTTSTQYYKMLVTTTNGNISNYTDVLSDIPNGYGGQATPLDTTPPVISSVAVPADTLKNNQAVITFTTDKLAKGTVQYHKSGDVSWLTVNSPSYTTSQSITIPSLLPNTTYNTRVKATDILDNVSGYTTGPDFTTNSGPVVTGVTANSITDTTATIEWNTSTSSDSYVFYSTAPSLSNPTSLGSGSSVTCSSLGTCPHSVSLSSLTAGITYYYYVKSVDGAGNTTINNNNGSYYSFVTTTDLSAPVISNISNPVISSVASVIVWQTDEPATTQVHWGDASGSLTHTTVLDSTKSVYHVVSLSKDTNDTNSASQALIPSTPYFFKVFSSDAAGNAASSTEQTFSTTADGQVTIVTKFVAGGGGGSSAPVKSSADPDIIPPTISLIETGNVGAFNADVRLTTNEDSGVFVDYGETTNYGSTEGDHEWNTSKTIHLKKLQTGTEYHYRVTARDRSGNDTTSEDKTFTTLFISELSSDRSFLDKASDIQGKIEQLIESALPSLSPPFVSTPVIANVTESSANITWKTNIKTLGSVHYAADSDYTTSHTYPLDVSAGQDKDANHSVDLANLQPNTTYHIQATSYVFPQVVGKTPDMTFTTKASKIKASIVEKKNDTFTVAWSTEEPSTSIVEYRNTKTGETNRTTDETKKTFHSMKIDHLPSGSTFVVKVSGINAIGNTLEAVDALSVNTSSDVTAPIISNFKVDNALVPGRNDRIQTVVGWQTDEPSNAMVYYEEGVGSVSSTTPSVVKELSNKVESLDNYTTNHIVLLSLLKPGTVYRVKVVSTDPSGNAKTFGPNTIITPRQTESVLDVIFKNFEDTFKFLRKGQ